MSQQFTEQYIKDLKKVLDTFPHDKFKEIAKILITAYNANKQIFIMGNGGSGATASHFVCDINKGCCLELEKKFRVICLNDNMPSILAYANDISYQNIFIEQLKNFLQSGDIVIGISGSGNSENVIRALSYAKKMNARTIGLSGFDGGKLAKMVDVALVVSVDDMQKIEDIHMIVVHMLMQYLYNVLNK
jgi:D-sedoheptulose 7-phosphate isomerase